MPLFLCKIVFGFPNGVRLSIRMNNVLFDQGCRMPSAKSASLTAVSAQAAEKAQPNICAPKASSPPSHHWASIHIPQLLLDFGLSSLIIGAKSANPAPANPIFTHFSVPIDF